MSNETNTPKPETTDAANAGGDGSLVDQAKEAVASAAETVTDAAAAAAETVKETAEAAVEAVADAVAPDEATDEADASSEEPQTDVEAALAESSHMPDPVEVATAAVVPPDEPGDDTRVIEAKLDDAIEAVKDEFGEVNTERDDIAPAVETTALTSVDDADALVHTGGMLGYTGEIQGRSITLAELEALENERAPDDAEDKDAQLLALYEASMSSVTENEIVAGRIVAISDKEYVIDIGFKSDGVISKNEFDGELEIGTEVDVYVDRLEDRRGQLILSKTKADDLRRWQTIDEAFETGGVLEGTIIRRIKGGMIVNLLGAEAFLPGSQVDVRPVRDFDVYLGKTMEFKVVKTNPANGNVVVSHKALIEKDLLEQRKQILDSMEPGQVLEGIVKNITNFGVFIDLGGVDGLLHITDLSWGRVGHPSEVVELDTKMNVVVLDYDKERQRISLGYKQLLPHPWENIEEKFAEGQEVEGRVVSITDYGAFVELEKGIEGLVHISEMSWTEHIKHPTQKVQLGQIVPVKILRIDTEDKKISLGMKQLEPDPWEGILDRMPVGSVTRGEVRNLTNFGAFVEIEPGIDGLVHVSDLSWTKRVKHPGEVVSKGDQIEVQILDIDVAKRRISLGHKQVQTDPWQQYATAYAVDTDTPAKVTDVNGSGVVVELPLEAEGFVPSSHLERQGDPTQTYAIGDELNLRVIRLDRNDRQIILSETAKRMAAERAERHAERAEKSKARQEEQRAVRDYQRASSGPATLGELSGLAALRDQLAAEEEEAMEDYEDDI
ncbi:MAG: 30S ribosomal protein S1 [Bacteroidota bacterium]